MGVGVDQSIERALPGVRGLLQDAGVTVRLVRGNLDELAGDNPSGTRPRTRALDLP